MKGLRIFLMVIGYGLTWLGAEELTLEACLERAYRNNPDLVKSRNAVENARIGVGQAASSFFPGISISASASTSGPIVISYDPEWAWNLGGGISQSFYRPGLYTSWLIAQKRKTGAEFAYAALKDQIRVTVEKVYYQILTSDTLIAVYLANIRLAEEQIRKTRQMVALGLKRESDLLKAEVQRGTFEAQLVREYETREAAVRRLNVLMGHDPSAPLVIRFLPVESVSIPDFQEARARMISRNPTLQRLKLLTEVQRLSLRSAREAYLPSLSGSYSYSRSAGQYGGQTVENDQVGIRMSLDLFSGFSRRLTIQREKVALEDARLDYEASLRDYEEALANQYRALETQNRLIAIHQTNLASARKDLEVVSRQYAEGFSSILDLMNAQVSLLESETNLLRDYYNRKLIESQIRQLIGGE